MRSSLGRKNLARRYVASCGCYPDKLFVNVFQGYFIVNIFIILGAIFYDDRLRVKMLANDFTFRIERNI